MAKRVKIHFNVKKLVGDFTKAFQKEASKGLKKEILDTIAQGKSPVAGKGKFKAYSKEYKKAIKAGYHPGKKTTPVNMKLTGKMLKSLKIRKVTNGLSIIFTDPKAQYHDKEGAGKSKVIRRLLPRKKERFINSIHKKIKDALDKAKKAATKAQNKR